MNIQSGHGYPNSALSNFAPHKFIFEGIECNSMEGLLQSFKFKNPEMQKEICKLVGITAKRVGSKKGWKRDQTLYWKGKAYKRGSNEYQELLDRAYDALFTNESFKKALKASGDCVLTHSIGRTNPKETILTQREFCSRLMKLRDRL